MLLACAIAALALPSTAMASKCGDAVLADWFDNGRIDRVYPLRCYQEAIDAIPADLRDYANVEEVISRALAAATNADSGGSGGSGSGSGGGSGGSGGSGSGGSDEPTRPVAPVSPGTGGGSEAAPTIDTSSVSSVPIPLLLLGGMSLALLGAGGLGYLSRRRHEATAEGLLDDLGDDDLGG